MPGIAFGCCVRTTKENHLHNYNSVRVELMLFKGHRLIYEVNRHMETELGDCGRRFFNSTSFGLHGLQNEITRFVIFEGRTQRSIRMVVVSSSPNLFLNW